MPAQIYYSKVSGVTAQETTLTSSLGDFYASSSLSSIELEENLGRMSLVEMIPASQGVGANDFTSSQPYDSIISRVLDL